MTREEHLNTNCLLGGLQNSSFNSEQINNLREQREVLLLKVAIKELNKKLDYTLETNEAVSKIDKLEKIIIDWEYPVTLVNPYGEISFSVSIVFNQVLKELKEIKKLIQGVK